MRQRDEVFSNQSSEQIVSTLEACSLEDKQEFTEDEAARIEHCRSLVEQQGKSYKQVAASFRRQDKPKQQSGEVESEDQLLDISELLTLVSGQVETRVSLTEAVQILNSCGLSDKEQYRPDERERFLEACDLLKKQNKSYEEVAAHFGKSNPQVDLKADMQEILSMVGSAVIASEDDLLRVLKELTAKRGHAISAMYERMLLTQVAQHLRERQQKRQFFTQFGEQLEAYVEGKSSIPSLEILPAFSQEPTLKSLPKSSDNS